MTEQLTEYVKSQRAAGVQDIDIKKALLEAGWKAELIEAALSPAQQTTPDANLRANLRTLQPSQEFIEQQTKQQEQQTEQTPFEQSAELESQQPQSFGQSNQLSTGSLAVAENLDETTKLESAYDTTASQEVNNSSLPNTANTVQADNLYPEATTGSLAPRTSPTLAHQGFVGSSVETEDADPAFSSQFPNYMSDPFSVFAVTFRLSRHFMFKTVLIALIAAVLTTISSYYASPTIISSFFSLFAGGSVLSFYIQIYLYVLLINTTLTVAYFLVSVLAFKRLKQTESQFVYKALLQFLLFSTISNVFFYLLWFAANHLSGTDPAVIVQILYLAGLSYLYYRYILYFSLMPFDLLQLGDSYIKSLNNIIKITKKRRRELFGYVSIGVCIALIVGFCISLIPVENLPVDSLLEFSIELGVILLGTLMVIPFTLLLLLMVAGNGYRYFGFRQIENTHPKPPITVVNVLCIAVAIASTVGMVAYWRSQENQTSYRGSSVIDFNSSGGSSSSDSLARDTERRIDINAIHTQLELFYTDNGYYPAQLSELTDTSSESLLDPDGYSYSYLPSNSRSGYCISGENNCTSYRLYTYMETDQDGDGDVDFDDVFERNSFNN